MNETSHDQTPEIGWGAPSQPNPLPAAGPTGWTRLRRVLFWVVVVACVPGVAVGAYAVVEDLRYTDDMWHGFGIMIGLLLGVPCLCAAVLAGFGLRAMRRGPAAGRIHALALGCALLLTLLLVTATPVVLLPAGVGALLVAGAFADADSRR